ncbi:MAG: hypothetical protein RBU21_16535, partial [FCB group bacterium]|nr:hypothetical protein [FCB group bacterium]
VFERRKELALLNALGFERGVVFRLLLLEYGLLLLMGTLSGGVAALVAMAPALASSGADVNPVSRAAVFLLVLACAGACVYGALAVGLRRRDSGGLQAE